MNNIQKIQAAARANGMKTWLDHNGQAVIWNDADEKPFVCIDADGEHLNVPGGILYGTSVRQAAANRRRSANLDKVMSYPVVRYIVLVICGLFIWAYTLICSTLLYLFFAFACISIGIKIPIESNLVRDIWYTLSVLIVSAAVRRAGRKNS
jgi:hypothetical protein